MNFREIVSKKKIQEAQKTDLAYIGGQKWGTPPYLPPGGSRAENFLATNWGWVKVQNEPLVDWIGENGCATIFGISGGSPVKAECLLVRAGDLLRQNVS